jgi:hypothetical protein
MIILLGDGRSKSLNDLLCWSFFSVVLCDSYCSCGETVGICLTRLETRTKEFSTYASHGVLRNLKAQ